MHGLQAAENECAEGAEELGEKFYDNRRTT